MKIQFTLFNNGQEHYEFDTDSLETDEKLYKFLINKDDTGTIYIVPTIVKNGVMYYPKPVLEKI